MPKELQIRKAERKQRKLHACLAGPSGSGKTYSALAIASGLGRDGKKAKILLLDTENESASLYADDFEFDTICVNTFDPETLFQALKMAADGGYDAFVVDSLTHFWDGEGGFLEQNDQTAKRSRSGNTFQAWGETTPKYRKFMRWITAAPFHFIGTLRTKTEYIIEDVNGKKTPKKIGLAPIFRQGSEYEFDLVGDMNLQHELIVDKTRIRFLTDKVISKPGIELGRQIREWFDSGKGEDEPEKPEPKAPKEANDAERILGGKIQSVTVDYEPEPFPFNWKLEGECRSKGKPVLHLTEKQIRAALKSGKGLTKRDMVNLRAAVEMIEKHGCPDELPKEVEKNG